MNHLDKLFIVKVAFAQPSEEQLAAFQKGTASSFNPNSWLDRNKMHRMISGEGNWSDNTAARALGQDYKPQMATGGAPQTRSAAPPAPPAPIPSAPPAPSITEASPFPNWPNPAPLPDVPTTPVEYPSGPMTPERYAAIPDNLKWQYRKPEPKPDMIMPSERITEASPFPNWPAVPGIAKLY